MKIQILGSGSKGNSILFDDGNSRVLVDVGFSCRNLTERLAKIGVEPDSIDAIVVTHEHSDHVRGLHLWVKKHGTKVFATRGTMEAVEEISEKSVEFVEIASGKVVEVGGFKVLPFNLSHDANDPVGLLVKSNGTKIGVATDLGCATALVRERLKGVDALVLEFNHDINMLMDGPYPWHLKDRIRKNRGHLSNEQAAKLLGDIYHDGMECVALAHMSETNNAPDLAVCAAGEIIKGKTKIVVAEQDCPAPAIKL